MLCLIFFSHFTLCLLFGMKGEGKYSKFIHNSDQLEKSLINVYCFPVVMQRLSYEVGPNGVWTSPPSYEVIKCDP